MSEWEPDEIIVARPRPWGRWLVRALFAGALVYGALYLYRMKVRLPAPAVATEQVRSEVTGIGDSLDIAVSWHLAESVGAPEPDSVRLEVGVENSDPRVVILPARRQSDTLRIAAPAPGTAAMGHSCVSAVLGGRLSGERCTPWQFVRPAADTARSKSQSRDTSDKKAAGTSSATRAASVLRLVVRPSGQQVDPDVGGKCAAWQRDHPGESVWLEVNRSAVPECTGPNGKPTIAQFCAFAVLQDGERVKTENSTNNPYCEELYHAWARERIS